MTLFSAGQNLATCYRSTSTGTYDGRQQFLYATVHELVAEDQPN